MVQSKFLKLGKYNFDIANRALVMGILNRTPDSFFDKGSYFDLDLFFKKAETLVTQGADILDVGGVKAGVGEPVSESEEIDRVVFAVQELSLRFDVAISVDTWNSKVAEESFKVGAVLGNDISGFQDPNYLKVAAEAEAGVVATHIRLGPRIKDVNPHYDNLLEQVKSFLIEKTSQALEVGIDPASIVIDPGLDLGKNTQHSLELLRNSNIFSELGFPLLLATSNKDFIGELLNLDIKSRRVASLAAASLGVSRGGRIIRCHDVKGTRAIVNSLEAILSSNPISE